MGNFFKKNPVAGLLMGPVLGTAIQGKHSPWLQTPLAAPWLQSIAGNGYRIGGLGSLGNKNRPPALPAQNPWEDSTYWQNYWKSNPIVQTAQNPNGAPPPGAMF